MNKATKGIIAGVAGIGLLSGGATFALWSDTETMAGGTITAGELDISKVAETRIWEDISADVTAHEIDPTAFQMVPGDTIRLSEDLKIELEGDNLDAQVVIDAPGLTGDLADHLDATYTVLYGDDEVPGGSGQIEDGTFSGFSPVEVGTEIDGNVYTVQIDVEFPAGTENQNGVNLQALLADMDFTLEQLR